MSVPALAPPESAEVLSRFQQHFRLGRPASPAERLQEVVSAFAQLPYENLTKVLKEGPRGCRQPRLRGPAEVIDDHIASGTGGTCFSLTATLLHLVRALGWPAEPILADRRYGPDTHCALLVWLDQQPHLIDPGFLLVQPIPLTERREHRLTTAFNEVVLRPLAASDRWELSTRQQGRSTYRLTFKTAPVDAGEFTRAWRASFDWDMMNYPVLSRVLGDSQLYVQGPRWQRRTRAAVDHQELPPAELAARIAQEFGIAPDVVTQALAQLTAAQRPVATSLPVRSSSATGTT